MNNAKKSKEKKTSPNKKHKPSQSSSKTAQSSQKSKKKQLKINQPSLLQLIKRNLSVISSSKFLTFRKAIEINLSKFNITKEAFDIKIINNIIFDERKLIVSVFKDNLIWDETSDFLKRFYSKTESISRIPKIASYYQEYSIFVPVYFKLNCCWLMMKNSKKKKKLLEMEEEKDVDNSKAAIDLLDNKKTTNVSYFIKPEEVNNDLTKSQSQLSYFIKKIADNEQFHNRRSFVANGNPYDSDNDRELSLSQYINNSELNNQNLNDIINNLSIQQSKANLIKSEKNEVNNIKNKKRGVHMNRYSKEKKKKEINHLNLDICYKNTRKGLISNHVESKTERITPSKVRTTTETNQKNHQASFKPQTTTPLATSNKVINHDDKRKTNTNNNQYSLKKNVCLNVLQIQNIQRPIIEAQSNRNDSSSQSKYKKLVLDIGNKTNKNDKSPSNIFNTNRNLVLSNDNANRKNIKKIVNLPSKERQDIKSCTTNKKVHIKKYLTKALINQQKDDKKTTIERFSSFLISHTNSTTPTGHFISKYSRNTQSSSNAHTTGNIKVTRTTATNNNHQQSTSLTKKIPTSLNARDKRSDKPLAFGNHKESYKKIMKTKVNELSKRIQTEPRREERDSQKYSRNNKILLQNNFQSTSSKRQTNANNGLSKPPIFSNSTHTMNDYSSLNTKNITININNQQQQFIFASTIEANSNNNNNKEASINK